MMGENRDTRIIRPSRRTTIPAHLRREAMRGPGLEPPQGSEGQGGDGHWLQKCLALASVL